MFFNKSYFWLELTDEEVRLLKVSAFGSGGHLLGATVLPLKEEEALQKAFRALGADNNPQNNEVRVLCNPKGAYAFLHTLDNHEQTLKAEELIKIPQSNLHLEDPLSYMHFMLNIKSGEPYDNNSTEKKCLFVGSRRSVMEEISLKIRNVGIAIKSVHWSLLSAIQGLLQTTRTGSENTTLLLLVGSESTWAVILNNEEVLAIRSLAIGTKSLGINFQHIDLTTLRKEAQSVAALERFQREIETFIGFYELENALTIGSLYFIWPQEEALPLSDYFKDTMGLKILSLDLSATLHKKGLLVDNKDSLIPLSGNGLALISSMCNF